MIFHHDSFKVVPLFFNIGLQTPRTKNIIILHKPKTKVARASPTAADGDYKMEYFMRSSGNDRLKTIVGFLLLCICSCARFGDAAKANPQGLEFQQANVLWLRAMRCRIQSCQVGCQVMSYLCQRHRQWQGLCPRQAAQ